METSQPNEFFNTFEDLENEITNIPFPKCCKEDPCGEWHTHPDYGTTEQLTLFPEKVEKKDPTIFTVSAVAFDFYFDEPRVLLVKNKKPPRKSMEGKPGGVGLPTGQLESKETMLHAVERETEDESGCSVSEIIGKLFVVKKTLKVFRKNNPENLPSHLNYDLVPNEIHVFLVEATDSLGKVREIDEIDSSFEPWVPLREVFKMPLAQNKSGSDRNPNGIYFSHLQRLYRAIESMVYNPEEELVDGVAIKQWLEPNRHLLKSAMVDIQKAGLLKRFLPDEDAEK